MKLEIGSYLLEVHPEKTREAYRALTLPSELGAAAQLFRYLLPRAKGESLAFLRSLGIDTEKLFLARPLTEPDEKGEALFLCTARLSGTLLRGGDTRPRQSEETAGISVIFVGEREEFSSGHPFLCQEETELRFVIPLPFDPAFFEEK